MEWAIILQLDTLFNPKTLHTNTERADIGRLNLSTSALFYAINNYNVPK